jgi:myo-inositol-1(or 4)-monophosphatase
VRKGLTVLQASYEDLVALAQRVAFEAADLVRTRRLEGVEVADTKSSPTDVVTEVDKASEAVVHERLLAERPDDGFVGEEGGSSSSSSGVTWIVDPIDGTVNFLYGIPQYSVSIAASLDDQVVAGVVVDVASAECFSATRGGGAWCDDRRLRVREVVPRGERLVITGFSYERDVRRLQADAVATLLPQVRDIRRLGSAALDLCYVGAGRADAYVEEGLNVWDRAAGGLVATEAGAIMEVHLGAGGKDCVICAPAESFADFTDLVTRAGFLKKT